MQTFTTTLDQLAMHGGDGPWADGSGPPFPFLFPLLWLVVIVGVVAVAILGRRRREAAGRRSGERVLAERYADGSITEDEYRARRAVLREK